MRRFQGLLVVCWVVAALSCGPAVPGDIQAPEDPERKPVRIAGDPGHPVPPQARPYNASPHTFSPRSHPPRQRYGDRATPNLKRLPKLQMRYNKCFGVKKEKKAAQIATGSSRKYKAKRSRRPGAKKPARARKPRGSGKSGGIADVLGAGDMSAVAGAPVGEKKRPAPEPSAAPAPAAQPPVAAAPAMDAVTAAESEAPESALREESKADYYAGEDDADEIAVSEPLKEEEVLPDYEDWGSAIYLSNDDTMSLSSAQRVIYAIDKFLPLPLEHIRPHELLNYFSFDTATVDAGNDFSVLGEVAPDAREEGIYTLGLAVRGRPVDKGSRRNVAITLVIDRSGSMRDEGRMNYLKRGLSRMLDELKAGDMVHLVLFDHEVCVPAENFVVGRDDLGKLKRVIDALRPRGSTDLHLGLSRGYEIADRSYQAPFTNRVVMITDALTNTGVTDDRMISMISKYYDSRRIRLSGVGVGRNFNDALLDKLTERGKGAYVFLGSSAEVDAVFGSHFVSLIETTALDVHFRLHLPPSLRMNVFYGEESSTVKEDVQEIHYFAGTSQLFLSDLMARGGELRPQDEVMLSIEYKDPETSEELLEDYAFNLGQISRQQQTVKKARLIMAWVDMLALMAARPIPSGYHRSGGMGSWEDAEGWQKCDEGSQELSRLAEDVSGDPEVRRVLELWKKFCARYERPRNPVRREIAPQKDSWPSAKPTEQR